jgi:hypothetical protein
VHAVGVPSGSPADGVHTNAGDSAAVATDPVINTVTTTSGSAGWNQFGSHGGRSRLLSSSRTWSTAVVGTRKPSPSEARRRSRA